MSKATIAALCAATMAVAFATPSNAKIILLNVDIVLDQVAPGEMFKVGQHDKMRVIYDDAAIDPKSHIVKPINMQHFVMGKFLPAHPDANFMPMNDAWLWLAKAPYRLHFKAAVTHGKPIIIDVNADTRRMTIHPGNDANGVLISGLYTIDSTPVTGAEAIAAATPAAK